MKNCKKEIILGGCIKFEDMCKKDQAEILNLIAFKKNYIKGHIAKKNNKESILNE